MTLTGFICGPGHDLEIGGADPTTPHNLNQPEPFRCFGETCDTFSCKPTSWRAPAREPPDVTCLHGLSQGHPKGVRSVAPVFFLAVQWFATQGSRRETKGKENTDGGLGS